ncbi:MAG: ABC transporter ATP-binding protein, partial [Coriobacteriia bacterium]|nr:ABC transporter ATP-binding protein [Coriobacteriia bacterium]
MNPDNVTQTEVEDHATSECNSPVVLEASNVTKTYVLDEIEVHALDGVDLQVCEGEMLAITGPSGSGK